MKGKGPDLSLKWILPVGMACNGPDLDPSFEKFFRYVVTGIAESSRHNGKVRWVSSALLVHCDENMPAVDPLSAEMMSEGDLEVVGYLPAASNYTYLARIVATNLETEPLVVYKPQSGEAPLWDFEEGTLCRREVAAYFLSDESGFDLVPPTLLRDGPYGLGAVQAFIDHDPTITAFDLVDEEVEKLRRVALFDVVTNNADRKAGHVFRDGAGKIWCVDHGICFHTQPKLRTVLWDFAGQPINADEKTLLEKLLQSLKAELAFKLSDLLSRREVESLKARTRSALEASVFPAPGPGRSYPWPPV